MTCQPSMGATILISCELRHKSGSASHTFLASFLRPDASVRLSGAAVQAVALGLGCEISFAHFSYPLYPRVARFAP